MNGNPSLYFSINVIFNRFTSNLTRPNVLCRISFIQTVLFSVTDLPEKLSSPQFLHIAQGSLSELDTQFEVALSLEYLKESDLVSISAHADEVDKMLTGLIKSLKRDS